MYIMNICTKYTVGGSVFMPMLMYIQYVHNYLATHHIYVHTGTCIWHKILTKKWLVMNLDFKSVSHR